VEGPHPQPYMSPFGLRCGVRSKKTALCALIFAQAGAIDPHRGGGLTLQVDEDVASSSLGWNFETGE